MSRAFFWTAVMAAVLSGFAVRHLAPRLLSPASQPSAAVLHDEATSYRTDFQRNPITVPCPKDALVMLTLGQSNAGNYGSARHRAGPDTVNFYDGKCYAAVDPLLGASGDRGSVWTLVGDRLATPERRIVLVPLAIGSSRMEEWAPGGRLHPRINYAVRQLARAGLSPTMSLVVQGETEGDGKDDPAAYEAAGIALMRSLPGKTWLATTTRCWGTANPAIRQAQATIRQVTGAAAGPDMDAVPNALRVNGCHYNAAGLQRLAGEWVSALS